MNDERTIAPKYGIELADLVIALAAGNVGGERFIERYVELLERGDLRS